MATPQFIIELREKVGHDLLWLHGVTGVVTRNNEVLLVRRADNGALTAVTGIIEPGEEPAVALKREIAEETCIEARIDHLAWVHVVGPMTYPNGDQAIYLDMTFRCTYVAGEVGVGDDENTHAGWYPLDALPDELSGEQRERITKALDGVEAARFVTGECPGEGELCR